MGGSSKAQTVGYKYDLGQHMIQMLGSADKLLEIRIDDRLAWCGASTGGQISISAPSLFGGESREGGVSGLVDVEMGLPDQGQNDYLVGQLGSGIPSYRNVTALVLRRPYLGMNPYLKPWSSRWQRINIQAFGGAQWYPEKAAIPSGAISEESALFFAIDASGSQYAEVSPGVRRWDVVRDALIATLQAIKAKIKPGDKLHIGYAPFAWKVFDDGNNGASETIGNYVRHYPNADSADIDDLIDVINHTPLAFGTSFDAGLLAAQSFFGSMSLGACARKRVVFISDGACWQISTNPATFTWDNATYGHDYKSNPGYVSHPVDYTQDPGGADGYGAAEAAAIAAELWADGVDIYAYNTTSASSYTAMLSNTGNVTQIDGSNIGAVTSAIISAVSYWHDMNPAHIIREVATRPDLSMQLDADDVDDSAFTAVADTLHAEGMGMSYFWRDTRSGEEFIDFILQHIDGERYVDRRTGKFAIRLIRDDYDAEALPVLDASNVHRVENFKRATLGEINNSVTLRYYDLASRKTVAIKQTDPALVQLQGGEVPITVDYPGFSHGEIAARALARDMRVLTAPLATCTVIANRVAHDFVKGDPFKLTWPEVGADGLIMRVKSIHFGDGINNEIRIDAVEDIFSLPAVGVSAPPDTGGWTNPVSAPAPCPHSLAVEAPYYELVQRIGQDDADAQLAAYPESGFLLVAGDTPTGDAIHAIVHVDAGAGYGEAGVMDFSPSGLLVDAVGPMDTSISLSGCLDLDQIILGGHAQLGDEIVRIDAIADPTASATTMTIGRGCLDTVPAAHAAGTLLLAWDLYAFGDEVPYASAENIAAKLLPVTGMGTLDVAAATAASVTMAQRAIRPYPPGQLNVCGTGYPEIIDGDAALSITWAHRDRLQQTAGEIIDHTAGSIGPENGVSYTLRVYGETDDLIHAETAINGTSYSYTTAAEIADSLLPGSSPMLTWTAQTSGFGASAVYGAAYSGSLWAICGGDSFPLISTSPDGVTWTSRTPSLAASNAATCVAHDGSGLFVAVSSSGSYTSNLVTSSDGITWTARISYIYASIRTVGYGGSLWVAAGDSGSLATSPGGTTWTARTSSFGTTRIWSVAYGSGIWVAVGDSGKLATSPDGVTWTQRTSSFGGGDTIKFVVYGGGVFVAGGSGGKIASSTDGITWSQGPGFGSGVIASIAYDSATSTWMCASGTAIGVSVDGITWSSFASGLSAVYTLAHGGLQWLEAGASGGLSLSPGLAYSSYRLNSLLRFELESVRDGLASYQHHNHTVYRSGWNFSWDKAWN